MKSLALLGFAWLHLAAPALLARPADTAVPSAFRGSSSAPDVARAADEEGAGQALLGERAAGAADFETEAVLPVVVSIRPDDPATNFRTEVFVHNVDAEPAVHLVLRTSAGLYEASVDVPRGGAYRFPDVVGAFVDRQTGVPTGADVSGTLTAQFRNGSGRMVARVHTVFGAGAAYPQGSTTGASFESLDPAEELRVRTRFLNGLRTDPPYRTNVGLANICGDAAGCATLDLSVAFRDDRTGSLVATRDVSVPPRQWVQLLSPIESGGEGDRGPFSMTVRAKNDGAAFDAYATVLDGVAHDATFLRARPAPISTVVLPVVVDAPGLGGRFVTELCLTALENGPTKADVSFRSSRTGREVRESVSLEPGRGVLWSNAVDHFRQSAPQSVEPDDSGPVRVSFVAGDAALVTARTLSSQGTGLASDAVEPASEQAKTAKRLTGLVENQLFRSNLAVANIGDGPESGPIEVSVSLLAPSGASFGAPLSATIQPGGMVQWNRLLAGLGAEGEGFTAIVTRTAGTGAFDAFATVIDNATEDASFVRGR